MNSKKVLATVTFEENCEYQTSTIEKEIDIPQQPVTITLETPINLEDNRIEVKPTGDEITHYYYEDRIQLQAHVTQSNGTTTNNIETGRVEFYFREGETEKLINLQTSNEIACELNKYGSTAVIFKPTSSGTVYAKYIDDNDLYIAEGPSQEIDLILEEVPIDINFTKHPSYITNVHDEVELEVSIKNYNDKKDIEYGTVTFLHYMKRTDPLPFVNVPKIIGNPVPVLNGKASIKYIPVQSDDDTETEELDGCIEHITAIYNYSGKYIDTDKSYKWKYYSTAEKKTCINVLARNSININTPIINERPAHISENTATNNNFQCFEDDSITIEAILNDKKNQKINFTNHYTYSPSQEDIDNNITDENNPREGHLTFHIKGVHVHPKKQHTPNAVPTLYYDDYEQVNTENHFIPYEKDFEISTVDSNSIFRLTLPPLTLLPGFYTITASTEIQTNLSDSSPIIDYAGTVDDVENDKRYASVNNSNTIYLYIDYKKNEEYKIELQYDDTINYTGDAIDNLKGIVKGLSNNQKEILNGKHCYFYVNEIHATYTGSLLYDNESNQLIGVPLSTEEIVFNIPNNYHVNMYIPGGVYSNNLDGHDESTTDFLLPYYMSNTITIQSRNKIQLSLDIHEDSKIISNDFTFTVQADHLSEPISVQLIAQPSNPSATQILKKDIILFPQYNTATGSFKIDSVGRYEVYAKSSGEQSPSEDIEVTKDVLTQKLAESSKKLFASPTQKIGVYISCYHDINLLNTDNLNTDDAKLHAYTYDLNQNTEDKSPEHISNVKIINKNTMYVEIMPKFYKECKKYLQITYEGDAQFDAFEGELEAFEMTLDEPKITLIPYDNNYDIEINSPHTNKNISNFLIMPVEFYKNTNVVGEGVVITNGAGKGSFNSQDNIEWWDEWTSVKFTFAPYDAEMISMITDDSETLHETLKEKYSYVFDYNDESDKYELYNQVERHLDFIFSTYKESTIQVSRPISL